MKRNYTIDCVSPLISYQPSSLWRDGTTGDPEMSKYGGYGHTFRLTLDQNARASFSFNGTGIWVYGAKRGNHGLYAVTIDGSAPQVQDGFAPGAGLFQTILFGAQDLPARAHTVEITNQIVTSDRPYFDIDFIVWEAEVPNNSSIASMVDDTNPAFQWLPSLSTWSTGCPSISEYGGRTCHVSSSATASTKISFIGESVALYGGVGPSHGPYVVQLDSRPSTRLNAFSEQFRPQQVMYFADKLGPGVHTLTVTNNPAKPGDVLDIDYIQVTGPTDDPTNLNATTPTDGSNPGTAGTKSAGTNPTVSAVIGATVAVVAILGIIAALWYFLYWRPRRNLVIRHQDARLDMDSLPHAPFGRQHALHQHSFAQTLNTQSQILEPENTSDRYLNAGGYAYSVEPPSSTGPSSEHGQSDGNGPSPVTQRPSTNLVLANRDIEQALPPHRPRPPLQSANHSGVNRSKSVYEGTGAGSDERANRRRESVDYDPPPCYS